MNNSPMINRIKQFSNTSKEAPWYIDLLCLSILAVTAYIFATLVFCF